jgi:hypothetical protein
LGGDAAAARGTDAAVEVREFVRADGTQAFVERIRKE